MALFFKKKVGKQLKNDVMRVVDQFYNINQQMLHLLNQALVVLTPKKSNAKKVSDSDTFA
jgi:hypothetical protein